MSSSDTPTALTEDALARLASVIESRKQGGMGAPETIPFSDRADAERFVAEHGGRIVTFTDVPQAYVLSSEPAADDAGAPAAHDHGTSGQH